MTRVLGIDPGYERLGVAILTKEAGKERIEFSDCLRSDPEAPLSERLLALGKALEALFSAHKPNLVAIETLFFNKNQKTAIAVAEARGMIIYLARKYGATVLEYSPQQVKVAVTGYGKSDKSQVMDMLARLLPDLKTGMLDDEYDAIAVALTCLVSHR